MGRVADIEYTHVYPVDDLREHEIEGDPCPCNPVHQIIAPGQIMVLHNAFDARELKEVKPEQRN